MLPKMLTASSRRAAMSLINKPSTLNARVLAQTCNRMIYISSAEHAANTSASNSSNPSEIETLSRVQHALLEALISSSSLPLSSSRRDEIAHEILTHKLPTCPTKLSYVGNDHTLAIPEHAFETSDECFTSLVASVLGDANQLDQDAFWKTFAFFYHSPRVVRCSDTTGDNVIQEENILWPH